MRFEFALSIAVSLVAGTLPVSAQAPSSTAARTLLVQSAPPRTAIAAPQQEIVREIRHLEIEGRGPAVRDETFASESLGRQMKYRVVLPAGYEATSRRFPVLYLLHGLWGDYKDWETKTDLVEHVRDYRLIVVMPDAGDSWYTNSAGTSADRFEDYIAKDLVKDVDAKFRTFAERHGRAIGGLSMGGYGALKFGLKYPGTFAFAAGFSGAVSVVRRPPAPSDGKPNPVQENLLKIYGPMESETRVANDVIALAEKADPARVPYFYVDCGSSDGLLPGNRELVAKFQERKIAYEYREVPGAHTWDYWNRQLPEMLRVLAAHLSIRG